MTNATNESKKNTWWHWVLEAILILAVSCCIVSLVAGYFLYKPKATTKPAIVPVEQTEMAPEATNPTEVPATAEAPAPVDQTEVPAAADVQAATEAPAPTEAPTKVPATEAPAPANPTDVPTAMATDVPVAVNCDTPSIQASTDGVSANEYGEYLDTVLGKRMTFTNRKVIIPAKAWNDPLTPAELKLVENTWLSMQVCIPEGTIGRIFAGGFEQGTVRYESGVILTLVPGMYHFNLRNGEVVIWYPDQGKFVKADLERIIAQIRVGNFDIKSPLNFLGVTPDVLPNIPDELVKERNVQLIPSPEADTTK